MKNSNVKRNIIIGATVTAVILIVVIGFALKASKPTYEQENPEDVLSSSLILEYGDEVKDEYIVRVKGEEITVKTPEGVDTMKAGETTHELETKEGKLKLKIVVEDTQDPIIEGIDEIEVQLNLTKDELENELNQELKASDPVDGELMISYTYDNKLKLDEEGTYDVIAVAQDKNGNKTRKLIKVKVSNDFEDPQESEGNDGVNVGSNESTSNNQSASNNQSTPNKPVPSKPAPSKPAPNKPAPSKPAPSKPAPSKPTPSKPTPSKPAPNKPAPSKPEPSKPEPSKPAPSNPEPSKPAPSKPEPSKPNSNFPSVPASLPGGAKHFDTTTAPGSWESHSYNYSKSLGGSANTSQVFITFYSSGGAKVSVAGTDEAGKSFKASATSSNPSGLSFTAYDASQMAQLSGAQKNEITNVILAFMRSYGL